MRLLGTLISLTLAFATGATTCCHAADALRDSFLRDAPPAWEAYRLHAKRLQGTVTMRLQKLVPRRETIEWHDAIKQGEGCALFVREEQPHEGAPPDRWLRVTNPTYAFSLFRKSGDAPWALSSLDEDLTDGVLDGDKTPADRVAHWTTMPITFALAWDELRSIPIERGFVLRDISRVEHLGRGHAKAAFTYRPVGLSARAPTLVEGWATYDVDKYWVLAEYELHIQWNKEDFKRHQVIAAKHTYRYLDDGFPVLRQIDATQDVTTEGYRAAMTCEFSLTEGDIPEREFTLSAFGFLEPGKGEAPGSWYLWTALSGLLCLIIAAALLLRRRQTAGARRRP